MYLALSDVSTVQIELFALAADPAFIAECNAWIDAKEQPLSDAELDAIERRAALADAMDDAALSLESQAIEVSL